MTDSSDRPGAPLESWKAIAAYLGRDPRTVRRWERSEGLPVHRHRHATRSSVYAYPHELDAWRASRSPEPVAVPSRSWPRRAVLVAAVVLTVLSAGGGRVDGSLAPAARQDGPFGNTRIDQLMTGSPATQSGTEFDFSPDGRLVAFAKFVGSQQARFTILVTRNLSTGEERELADVGRKGIYAVAFSPDGFRVAARLRSAGAKTLDEELLIADVRSATKPIVLPWSSVSNDTFYRFRDQVGGWLKVAWSPDGKWLAHLSPANGERFDVRVFNVASGESHSVGLTTDAPPDFLWSPAGDRLAVHRTAAAAALDEIALVSTAGTVIGRVPLPAGDERQTRLVSWRLPGEIVIRRKTRSSPFPADDIAIAVDTGATRKICSTPAGGVLEDERPFGGTGGPANVDLCLGVTRDGVHQIVWQASSERLMVRTVASGADRPLTTGSGREGAAYLSPYEPLVVFVSNRDGRWALYAAAVDRAPVSDPVMLARLAVRPHGLAVRWSREGFAARITSAESHLFRLNMDPKTGRAANAPERLTQDDPLNMAPGISPDGSRIAFWTERGLALMNADGSRERVFSERTPATILDPPRWRSADELITVVRQGNDGEGRRFQLINVRSGAVEDVRGGAFPANLLPAVPRWSYARATDEIVYLAPAATAGTLAFHARRVGDGAGRILATMNPTGGRVYSFLVSPDAQQIAYVLQREKGCTPCELGLLVVPTGERTVVASPNNLQTVDAWSPDGRFVLHGPARPRVLDVASRQSWPLIEPPDQTTWNEEGEGAWAPDGSFVVIVVDTTVREWRQFRGVTIKAVGR